MPRAKNIKFTAKLQDFVLDEMCKGKQPAEIFREHSKKLPSIRTFNRHQIDDPEFKEKVDAAYTVIYQIKQAEMDRLSTGLASDHYPDSDFRQAEAALKRRIDALKFDLAKMAGTFSRRYDKVAKTEISGDMAMPTIVIQQYGTKEEKGLEDLL